MTTFPLLKTSLVAHRPDTSLSGPTSALNSNANFPPARQLRIALRLDERGFFAAANSSVRVLCDLTRSLSLEHKKLFWPFDFKTGNLPHLVYFCDCRSVTIAGRRSRLDCLQGGAGVWDGDVNAQRNYLRQRMLFALPKKYSHYSDGNANVRVPF